MRAAMSVLYSIMEWIMKCALVHFLWILFTLAGGIVFGLYPATTALFSTIRDWLRGKHDVPVFRTYWKYYKMNFLKSNQLGLFITVIILLIGMNLQYIMFNHNQHLTWTHAPLFAFMLLFLLFLFYIFPVFAHFELPVFQMIKQAFLIMMIHPIHTGFMILCMIMLAVIIRFIPALAFLFGTTGYAFITMWLAMHAFQGIEKKLTA